MQVEAISRDDVTRWANHLEHAPAEAVVRWALDEFGSALGYSCSFGAEGMVLLDLLAKTGKAPRIFTIDTGRLPQEVYDLIQTVQDRYGLEIEVYFPKAQAVEEMVRSRGPNLFYRSVEDRQRCCAVRKLEPFQRALRGLDAWMSGLRRDQGGPRSSIGKVELDSANDGLVKIHPLVDWTASDVWSYIRRYRVPYNPLHDQGYPSIGCAPCTRAVAIGEGERAGRWWWEQGEVKECGIHIQGGRALRVIRGVA